MPKLTSEPDSTGDENQKEKIVKLIFIIVRKFMQKKILNLI
jgi:hypothetical protein